MKLGIETSFDAAHRLTNLKGKCEALHGHTYKVEVVVEGEKKADGLVAEFSSVRNIAEKVLGSVDHKFLNDMMDNPTTENIASLLYEMLDEEICRSGLGIKLFSVKVWEGEGKWVEVKREDMNG